MKSKSTLIPASIYPLGNGRFYVNYNVVENELEDSGLMYDYETVVVEGEPTYSKVVDALIRDKYTISEEFSINRQRETKPDEFIAYMDFAEECKKIAKGILNITEDDR